MASKQKPELKKHSLEMKALKPIATASIFPPDQLEGCGCGKFIVPPDTFTAPSESIAASLVESGHASR